jgi:hypothetical protein
MMVSPALASGLHSQWGMDRALRLARMALESSGEVGVAISLSLVALHFLWLSTQREVR